MSAQNYTASEMMTITAARLLKNGMSCFVGIGLPSLAANLARLTHAPDLVLIYESGPIGAKPHVLPLFRGRTCGWSRTSRSSVSVPMRRAKPRAASSSSAPAVRPVIGGSS